jgi:uncharacterized linocin/CFP29 family protein
MANEQGGARVDTGKTVFKSAGRWAGERLLAAHQAGRSISPSELRTLATLPRDSWKAIDDAVVREGVIRAPLVGDLIAAGLTIPIANAMGRTMFSFELTSDMDPAVVSLDGRARGDNDAVDFIEGNVPLPLTHKDFNIPLRKLEASRLGGQPLDTTQAETASRLVMERVEEMTIVGGPTFGGVPIYGLLNHPSRSSGDFGANGNWLQTAKTGANIFKDVSTAISALRASRRYGPYWMIIPGDYGAVVDDDYKAQGDRTIRDRLLQIEGMTKILVSDQMPANNVVIFEASKEVVAIANGEQVQTVQWEIEAFEVGMKVFAIQVPVIRATHAGRSGIYHMVAP